MCYSVYRFQRTRNHPSTHIFLRSTQNKLGAFLMQQTIFVQRAQRHRICMERHRCVRTPPFGVAATGRHYGAGRTVFKQEDMTWRYGTKDNPERQETI